MALAWVGLGGNVGDVGGALAGARRALRALADGPLLLSPLYRSAPWGRTEQPAFINQVAGFDTPQSAVALLDALLDIEERYGRTREVRWGPRTLDLDLLSHGETICRTATLTLPHPRIAARRFVLEPWADLAPDFALPGDGRTIAGLLAACSDVGDVWRLPDPSVAF